MNLCVCHHATIQLVDLIGMNYDSKVCQWMESLRNVLDLTSVSIHYYN